MDSYEYYLLFHKNSSNFIGSLLSDSENREILVALQRIIINKKLTYDIEKENIFSNVWQLVQKNQEPNPLLFDVFTNLLDCERFESHVKFWILKNLNLSENTFQLIRVVITNFIVTPSCLNFFKEIAGSFIENIFRGTCRSQCVHHLRLMIKGNKDLRQWILNDIFKKSLDRGDHVAMSSLCDFFDDICSEITLNNFDFLQNCFESSQLADTKSGIFLIKTLVHRKVLQPKIEDSFKKFTIILETLQENQSHLILPTLPLANELEFTEPFENFWFIVCKLIITHDNTLVRNWGLNFILNATKLIENDGEIIIILEVLNSTCLYEVDQQSISLESLEKFVTRNFLIIFRNLDHVNWVSIPFYRILEMVAKFFSSLPSGDLDQDLIPILLKQTELIPKRVKNLVIRSGVQQLYAEIAKTFVKKFGFELCRKLVFSIYSMGDHNECLAEVFSDESYDCLKLLESSRSDAYKEFVFMQISKNKTPKEIIESKSKNLQDVLGNLCLDKLIIKKMSTLERLSLGYNDFIATLIAEKFKELFSTPNLDDVDIEVIELATKKMSEPDKKTVGETFAQLILRRKEITVLHPLFWKIDRIMLQNSLPRITPVGEILAENINSIDCLTSKLFTVCHYISTKLSDGYELVQLLREIEHFMESSCTNEEISSVIILVRKIIRLKFKGVEKPLQNSLDRLIGKLIVTIIHMDDRKSLLYDLTVELLTSVSQSRTFKKFDAGKWIDKVTEYLKEILNYATSNETSKIIRLIINLMESSVNFNEPSSLIEFSKNLLIDKVLETEILTKEQQIELSLGDETENRFSLHPSNTSNNMKIRDKKLLRVNAARILAKKFPEEFPMTVESYMEDFAKASKKKPRYFPNSWIHRKKLHCLQPLIFCEKITERTLEILVDEILHINNQLNVTYIIEIILARHHPCIIEILNDDLVCSLKSPAFKSIFAIAVMQLRMEDSCTLLAEKFFGIAEMKLDAIHDAVISFTMGQNYTVRSYAQATIIILNKHVKSLFGSRESVTMAKVEQSCKVIKESMRFKNAAKFVELLKKDFRFTRKFKEIHSVNSFYNIIPQATKMPFEEILPYGKEATVLTFQIAEMETDLETYTVSDELAIPERNEMNSVSMNLQQKYIPYKYQTPVEQVLSTLPDMFGNEGQFSLKRRSNLIVIASLISRPPNLGGLARTCEIFGVKSYVVESLKLKENSDFKALSKTAEKWLEIVEIKRWQLMDYLWAKKQEGYCIVGAEQSGESVPITKAKIPQKCVLLLGNEKEGIPANLLSLLDLTIELPQLGVVRSLNVHVTGAIVIWEYAKQHSFK